MIIVKEPILFMRDEIGGVGNWEGEHDGVEHRLGTLRAQETRMADVATLDVLVAHT